MENYNEAMLSARNVVIDKKNFPLVDEYMKKTEGMEPSQQIEAFVLLRNDLISRFELMVNAGYESIKIRTVEVKNIEDLSAKLR